MGRSELTKVPLKLTAAPQPDCTHWFELAVALNQADSLDRLIEWDSLRGFSGFAGATSQNDEQEETISFY